MSAKFGVLKTSNSTSASGSEFDGSGRTGVAMSQLAPYGIISRAPSGSIVVTFPMNGDESDVVGIADALDKGSMPEPAEGEIVIGNYQSGCFMHFKNDGEIDINGKINHTGDYKQTGDTKSTGVVEAANLKTPTANFNDHVHKENDAGTTTGKPE